MTEVTPETPSEETTPTETEGTETVDLAAEVEKWKSHARTWEQRATQNKEAADRLAQIEDAAKSDLQKAQEKAEKLEAELAEAKFSVLKSNIAAKYGISEEDQKLFLTGTDSELLEAQAKALAERNKPVEPQAPVVGNVIPGLGDRSSGSETNSQDAVAREFFGL